MTGSQEFFTSNKFEDEKESVLFIDILKTWNSNQIKCFNMTYTKKRNKYNKL